MKSRQAARSRPRKQDGGIEPKPTKAAEARTGPRSLQQAIGNAGMQRLLTRQRAREAPDRHHTPLLIQRDVLGDVRTESEDFWVNLRSRVFTRYVSWIGDARAKLQEFTDVMKESSPSNAWVDAFKAWLGVAGTPGDLTNAVIETLGALKPESNEDSTLSEFTKQAHRKMDVLSGKVNDLKSDMPVYQTLTNKEQEEKGQTDKDAFRKGTRDQLERALALLPNAEKLFRELTINWTRGGSHSPDTAKAHIYYSTVYSIKTWVNDSGFFVWEESPGEAYLRGADNAKNTLKALTRAFGESYPLHKLPIRMEVRFFEKGGYGVGTIKKMEHAWVPKEGLGSVKMDDLTENWLSEGAKPTLADLKV